MSVQPVLHCYHNSHLLEQSAWYSAQSTLTNKSRLKLLHRREEHLQDLFSTSRTSILSLAKDEGRYIQFLQGVIVQGYLQLLEPSVTVHSRSRDVEVVVQASDAAAEAYKEISGRDIEFDVQGTLSDEGWVSSSFPIFNGIYIDILYNSAGGIKLVSGTRRITLDNTLDERLRLLEDRVSPPNYSSCRVHIYLVLSRCYPRLEMTFLAQTRTASFIHKAGCFWAR
jgi:Archaeal/vacuolar-type H+-ATPase subunit E